MFETLELQYLNKLIEGKVGDFASPKPFHTLKVECLSGDMVKPSAEVSGKFVVPVLALVGDFTVKPCQFSQRTPPIARTFHLTRQGFVKFAEFIQRLFQRLRMLDFLTGVQRQIGSESKVCSYAFTCSGQNFFRGVICNNGQPKRSNGIAKDLNIPDFTAPIAMVVIQDVPANKNKPLFVRTPFFEGQANRAFRYYRRFSVFAFFKNLVACLELRRTPPSLAFELRGTHATTATTVFNPIKETLVSDMDTDDHLVKRIAGDPRPVFMGALKQLRQMRLQPIPTGVLSIHAIVPLLHCQEVVMHIVKIVEHVADAFVLRMLAYLIFIGSHGVSQFTVLTPV